MAPYGLGEFNKSDELTSTFKELLSQKTVVNVPARADIASGLAQLGVAPDVQHSSSSLIHIHRADGRLDHFFFTANSATEAVD